MREHRADDDPDGASVTRIAAGGTRLTQALSSAGVSRRRSLMVSQPDAKRSVEHSGSERQNSVETPPQAEVAHEAHACGALGCRRDELLLEISLEGETRVLCRDHARRWAGDA